MLRPSARLLKAASASAAGAAGAGAGAATAVQRGVVTAPASAATSAHRIVLLVRDDLKMDRGKIAVQCSHAALLLYTLPSSSTASLTSPLSRDVARWRSAWQAEGHPALPLRIPDLHSMHALALEAQQRGVPTAIVRDAGRTQVQRGSETVLGIGPAEGRVMDEICGHLDPL
ncbi:peptidyl-tRNA hydrolase II [Microstroma glucosiphilum]|uniref:peptidyl-tRNA hydrolase n=1 Tax=Pseudomicrostroma glucosiphilum TaxID=1684307 RepID=A0A316U9G8_9BASI|nr:peptidyl-tRNA hydrolase II [Pseudomicrostroma glucosiphilum]PWN19645.1 peptidyl-tRNA hydrolase II [Pseudomicrostroma glucosiphilum]